MISVVIPLYNKENSILTTIESVLNQSFTDFELIVVDDGSTDKSVEIVRQILDPRLRLILKNNGGVSSARNEGIQQSRCEYVAFLDADDLWEKDFLFEIHRLINDFPQAGILGTSYSYLKGGYIYDAAKPISQGFYGLLDNSSWHYAHLYCSSAVCCKKEALVNVGMFDERIVMGEDLDVWWKIMLNFPMAYSNKSLAIYRFDEPNRAMNKLIPLNKHYIFYVDKFNTYRSKNDNFRHFIDKECMWWLYRYALDSTNKSQVKRILSNINLNEYKWTFKFRFLCPRIYHLFQLLG